MSAVGISAIVHELGEARPVAELADRGGDAQRGHVKSLLDHGLRSYRAAQAPLHLMAMRCIRATLSRAGVARDSIGAVVYATETLGVEEATARALGTLVAEAGLRHAYPLPVFGSLCGNLGSALALARDLVESGESERVLVVVADAEAPGAPRVTDPPVTVSSDGALSFLVDRSPTSGFWLRGLTQGVHRAGAPEGSFPMLQEARRAIKKQLAAHLAEAGWPRERYGRLVMNNYLPSTMRFFAMSAGFPTDKLFTGTVADIAHVGASDGLINAQACVAAGLAGPGDALLLMCNGLAPDIDAWGFASLEVVGA